MEDTVSAKKTSQDIQIKDLQMYIAYLEDELDSDTKRFDWLDIQLLLGTDALETGLRKKPTDTQQDTEYLEEY